MAGPSLRTKEQTTLLLLIISNLSMFINGVRFSYQQSAAYVKQNLEEELKENKGTGCEIPKTDPFASELMVFSVPYEPIKCEGVDWVRCHLFTCNLIPGLENYLQDIECVYAEITYINDFKYHTKSGTVLKGPHVYKFNNSDHVVVNCQGSHKGIYYQWEGLLAGFRPLPMRTAPQGRKRSYNVLILGFDSTSKNGFIRKMNESYEYLKNEFEATFLNGYNIVGDGTAAALIPMLTGHSELELPECRRNVNNISTDGMPLIFYKLKEDGYRTLYFEDMPHLGTFQWRFNGFRNQPTDHYLRAFFMEDQLRQKMNPSYRPRQQKEHDLTHFFLKDKSHQRRNYSHHCIGDTPRFQIMLNLTEQFFLLDGKKFALTFIGNLTHDDFNFIDNADKPFAALLRRFKESGSLKRTLVIIMGDHGSRYSVLRQTLQGKLEERLALMAIRLPDDLVKKRPDAKKALEFNSNVLTTPFDIHATILDVVDMKQHWNPYKIRGADLRRSLSILEPIPKSRSCSEAGIQSHWCSCLQWEKVNDDDYMYAEAAERLVDHINALTEFLRPKCAVRKLMAIEEVQIKTPNKQLLRFRNGKDDDGYVGVFGNVRYTQIARQVYQVKIVVSPGASAFEGTMTYFKTGRNFTVDAISRTNKYGDEPACLHGEYPHIHAYCYCNQTGSDKQP